MEITKKRIVIFIFVLLVVSLFLGYKSYVENRIMKSLMSIERTIKVFNWADETDNVEIERVIRRSPKEIIMIVKWDEHRAYVSIENWLTKAGDKIVINMFDKDKGLIGYE